MLETREGGCHCGEVRFRAKVDLDLLSCTWLHHVHEEGDLPPLGFSPPNSSCCVAKPL